MDRIHTNDLNPIVGKSLLFLLFSFFTICIIVIFSSIYSVKRDQQVIITQFGKIIGEPVRGPGLHFKIPFVQKANYLPQHLVSYWESDLLRFSTLDHKFLLVRISVLWKISDPLKYFKTVGNEERIPSLFNTKIQKGARDAISSKKLRKIISVDHHNIGKSQQFHNNITSDIKNFASTQLEQNGIKLINLKLKGKRANK